MNKISLIDVSLYTGYINLLLYFLLINLYNPFNYSNIFLYFGVIFITFTILNRIRKSVTINILYSIFFIVVVLSFLRIVFWGIGNNEITLFVSLLIYIAITQRNLNTILKISLIVKTTFVLIVLFLYSQGLLESRILISEGRYRNSLGFYHPNTLSAICFAIYLEAIYLTKKNKMTVILIGFVLSVILNLFTDSRTVLYSTVIFLILFFCRKLFSFSKYFIYILPLVVASISIYLPILYGKYQILYTIDKILSGRIMMSSYFINEVGLSLWGRALQNTYKSYDFMHGWNMYYILDSSYLRVLLQYGIVIFIIIIIMITKNLYYYLSNKMYLEVCLIITILFFSFFESYSYNVMLLPIVLIMLKVNKKPWKENKEKIYIQYK